MATLAASLTLALLLILPSTDAILSMVMAPMLAVEFSPMATLADF
jgi:hypothetical protein